MPYINATDFKKSEVLVARLERKLGMMRQEFDQYIKDLRMWQATNGSEYPQRRAAEILAKLEEIEKV